MTTGEMHVEKSRQSALIGTLLGTALGDALGLPAEGMRPRAIQRRFGDLTRFHLLGRTGFVSDDTEQSALVAQSLLRARGQGSFDLDQLERQTRRALVGWFLRLPFGVGLATLRACVRMLLGIKRSGVDSAGNGAAMRAPILGVTLCEQQELRRAAGRRVAALTHRDPRAVEGALFAAELAARAAATAPQADRAALARQALSVVTNEELEAALENAIGLDAAGTSPWDAALALGTSGYVVHSLAFALFCFLRHGAHPLSALQVCIAAGGDTDTSAAMVGAWCGALGGEECLPPELVGRIHDGPFGPGHLRALGRALAVPAGSVPGFAWSRALLRNVLLFPVILAHGLRRLLPF